MILAGRTQLLIMHGEDYKKHRGQTSVLLSGTREFLIIYPEILAKQT